MELLILVALVWAGLQWVRTAPDPDDRMLAATAEPDPQATGSIRISGRAPPNREPAGGPDEGAVKSLFGVLELLGRR
jgi:hypothetical protein